MIKSIGIIGGAGPMAGVALCERIIRIANVQYKCVKDCDFPRLVLISFPFSDMLSDNIDTQRICAELEDCIQELKRNGAVVMAIACNTLHAFIDTAQEGFISLPEVTKAAIDNGEIPLVLCTSTSRNKKVHSSFFPCIYPDNDTQKQVDYLIEAILQGKRPYKQLSALIRAQDVRTVILGCTELSLMTQQLRTPNHVIIDPLDLVAQTLLKQFFINKLGGNYV